MSQARLPRTEPSTELISAHKVNHRAALAGRALGIFAKVRSHRVCYIGMCVAPRVETANDPCRAARRA